MIGRTDKESLKAIVYYYRKETQQDVKNMLALALASRKEPEALQEIKKIYTEYNTAHIEDDYDVLKRAIVAHTGSCDSLKHNVRSRAAAQR